MHTRRIDTTIRAKYAGCEWIPPFWEVQRSGLDACILKIGLVTQPPTILPARSLEEDASILVHHLPGYRCLASQGQPLTSSLNPTLQPPKPKMIITLATRTHALVMCEARCNVFGLIPNRSPESKRPAL
jgi:hypothetical protein